MHSQYVRPRTVQFEDGLYIQNARSSSSNTTNSSAKTVVNKSLYGDRCYECLAIDDDEDGGEGQEDDGDERIDVADDPMGENGNGPVGTSGAGHSTNVTPTQSKDVTAELDTKGVQRPNVG